MFDEWTWRRRQEQKRLDRIKELDEYLGRIWASGDPPEAITAQTEYEQNERDYLEQVPLRTKLRLKGITVPADLIHSYDEMRFRPLLTEDGEIWARNKLREHWIATAKDVVAVLTPVLQVVFSILSAIIGILGLLVALEKK